MLSLLNSIKMSENNNPVNLHIKYISSNTGLCLLHDIKSFKNILIIVQMNKTYIMKCFVFSNTRIFSFDM